MQNPEAARRAAKHEAKVKAAEKRAAQKERGRRGRGSDPATTTKAELRRALDTL